MSRATCLWVTLLIFVLPVVAQESAAAGSATPPACAGQRMSAHPVTPDSLRAEQEQGALLLSAIPSAEPMENFALQRVRLARYGDCTGPDGCYWADLDAQFRRAERALAQALAQKHSGERFALILDVDETSLSNYCEMKREDFGYIAPLYDTWSVSSAADVAIPGALRLYHEARAAGVTIFFITGRPGKQTQGQESASMDQTDATQRNLEAAGFMGWGGLRLRNGAERQLTTIEYKQHERALIEQAGYTLLMSVGDQWSDLLGAPAAAVNVKLPNPFYFIP